MRYNTLVLVLLALELSGCRDKIICPAFQSTYILDDSVRYAYFSYLWKLDDQQRLQYLEDRRSATDTSITDALIREHEEVDYYAYVEPYVVPPREVKKNRYGMVSYQPYWLKNYRLRTAPMENILAPEEPEVLSDSMAIALLASDPLSEADLSLAAGDSITSDSLAAATARASSRPKEPQYLYRYDPSDNFNVEQEYYNKYFGKYLVDTGDNRRKKDDAKDDPASIPSDTVAVSVESRGFLKFLRKKDKPVQPETSEGSADQESASEPVIAEPETTMPETTVPETIEPAPVQPETIEPETTEPADDGF